ncbi:phytoene desaturase family protein [Picrophilus oshimae]|uniref:Phytoene dehydrogenase n=1 Tax=Picrophilus torridus (strain ATCC 700027 / DSM 9790 / JCM 10055 / NBRC 100828 / KAW 2/3) TaxID=1122961 RepID=Q6KYT5_PICTO|nr:phytoene desaturase family protein [Picrophilus oshimae]AAT44117.1 phytoene dehydrogenase [Picrophilus oshimae DSM 9789]
MKIVIVGGGYAGLSLANLVARDNDVILIEKNKTLGGRSRSFYADGYKFDMGPSWYLMPEVFEHYFQSLGLSRHDFYSIKRLDPAFRICIENSCYNIRADPYNNMNLFNSLEDDGYKKFDLYLEETKKIYDAVFPDFIYRDFSSFKDMLSPDILKNVSKLHLLDSMMDLSRSFFSSKSMRYITTFSSVFLGGNPFNIPAFYSMVNYSMFNDGVYYPENGFSSVVSSLYKIGRSLNVRYITSCEVGGININNNEISSIMAGNNKIDGDLFIFAGDYYNAESMLPPGFRNYSESFWKTRRLSPSAVLAYIGLKKKLAIEHHNIIIPAEWNDHFNSIDSGSKYIPENFSFYLSVRSKTDKNAAPENMDSIFMLIPASPFIIDTEFYRSRYVFAALSKLEEYLNENIIDYIDFIKYYGPSDFKSDYNSFMGTAFGLANTMLQTAYFRPLNRNRLLRNMYYTGQYTHPGIGVPMAFVSAEVIYNKLIKEKVKSTGEITM